MLLKPEQKQWLTELDSKAAAQVKLQTRENLKTAVIAKMTQDREGKAQEIRKGASQKVVQTGTGKPQDTLSSLDQTKVFDLDEQRQGFVLAEAIDEGGENEEARLKEWAKGGGQKNFQELQKTGRIIQAMTMQMQQEVDELDENGDTVMVEVDTPQGKVKQPRKTQLFSPDEIKEELYTPLVRRGLIPETFVPDEFSETKEMLDGSFNEYAKRLEKEGTKSFKDENLGMAINMFRGLVSAAGAVQATVANLQLPSDQLASNAWSVDPIKQNLGYMKNNLDADKMWADTADKAAQGWVFGQQCLDIAFDWGKEGFEGIVDRVKTDKEESAKQEEETTKKKEAANVAGLALVEISAALAKLLNHPNIDLGSAASSSFSSLVSGSQVTAMLGEKDIAGAGVLIWTALEATVKGIDPKMDGSTQQVEKSLAKAKSDFDGALKAGAVLKNLEAKEYGKAASALAAGGLAAVKALDTGEFLLAFHGKEKSAAAQEKASKIIGDEFARDDRPKPDKEQIDEHPEDHAPQWMQTKDGIRCLLCGDDKEDPEMFAGILERKIKELERDQLIWKWVVTIIGMGFDQASNFLVPMAAGGALVRAIKNVKEAHQRRMDWIAFLNHRKTMVQAACAFSAPAAQFVSNSSKQFLHYTANATAEFLKMAAAIMQCSAVAVIPGVARSGAVNTAQALEGVVWEAKKRWDLETAWTTYKTALENPENRKLGLMAMKSNPTLAKYAMAWGALIKKDPLVGDFMRSCGLEEGAALKDPQANIDLVVSYLEKRMPDDNVVVGRDYSAPNKVDLTAAAWLKEKAKLEKTLKVVRQDTGRLELLLSQWNAEYPKQEAIKDRTEEMKKTCLKMLGDIDSELLKYIARTEEGTVVHEAADMRGKFMKQVAVFRKEVQSW